MTVAAFAECVEHGPCRGYVIPPHPHPELFTDQNERRFLEAQCTWGRPGLDNHPINCVTWNQARQFCEFRHTSLPTEAQWEFAARGTDGRLYPWGNEDVTDSTRGNFADQAQLRLMTEAGVPPGSPYPFDDGYGATAPVGSYSAGASAFGVLDLEGNVKEWIADVYFPRGRDFGETDRLSVRGTGVAHVTRGGSWLYRPMHVIRGFSMPDEAYPSLGFRCASSADDRQRSAH